jgi:cardiolipin synthase
MIFFNSQKLMDKVIEDLDASQISVDIEVYIWDPDEVGKLFEDALIRAVNRGVKVRVIVDRVGSLAWISGRMSEFIKNGVEVRVFRPLLSLKTIFKYFPKSFNALWTAVNRRNHRKTFTIDKKITYIGSFNIMQPALKWKEITAREEDPSTVLSIVNIFECTWERLKDDARWFKKIDYTKVISDVKNSKRITTTQTRILSHLYRKEFIQKINSTKNRLWFLTPYFNPPGFFLRALVAASKRGVDVRLLVPRDTIPVWFKFLSRLYYSHLLKKGVKVYEYGPGLLHAKTTLFDTEGIIGSGNLNYRSFYLDLELNLTLTRPEEIVEIHDEFIKDIAKSKEIKLASEVKIWERVFGAFLMIFKTSF